MYSNPLPAYAYRAAALLRRARPPEPRVRRGDGGSAVVRLREALGRTKAEANRVEIGINRYENLLQNILHRLGCDEITLWADRPDAWAGPFGILFADVRGQDESRAGVFQQTLSF